MLASLTLLTPYDTHPDVQRPDKLSCAEISSICQAAGLQAVRKNRYVILPADFEEAWKQTVKRSDETLDFCEFSLSSLSLPSLSALNGFLRSWTLKGGLRLTLYSDMMITRSINPSLRRRVEMFLHGSLFPQLVVDSLSVNPTRSHPSPSDLLFSHGLS